MAINQAVCASFKKQLLEGDHDIDNDTINLALYTSSATLDGNTTAFSATNEAVSYTHLTLPTKRIV